MTDHPIDADAAKLWLDDPTLDRIIAEVGETITKPDRDVLRHDLLTCYGQYSIRKNAKKLVGLLKADDADVGIIRALWPISPERPAHLLPQMIFLVERIDAMTGMEGRPGDIAERTKAKQGMSGSALQWLTGTLLPDAYSKHFHRKAGRSRNPADDGLGGPYMRFARRVLAEMKIECSDETIAKALQIRKFLKK
jgi:hypothetical protein